MKIISLNIRGFRKGKESKVGGCRKLIMREKPNVVALQETKCKYVDDKWVNRLWGSDDFGFIQKEKVEKSGGMLIIWDKNSFVAEHAIHEDFFIAVKGRWLNMNTDSFIVNVYGPQDDSNKLRMWLALEKLVGSHDGAWVICGDFNEVRNESERMNCEFSERRAKWFNNFINNSCLVDVPLAGKKYTRICDNGLKFSKLDRFLISDEFGLMWGDISVVALERDLSDHCPIILRDKVIDFGPKPIKVFDEWIETDGASKIITNVWNQNVVGWRKDNIFRIKMRNVKLALRQWSIELFGNLDLEIHDLCNAATKWEIEAKNRCLSVTERNELMETRRRWLDKEKIKTDMANKLEEEFTEKEVFVAICECSSSKAPGPDGYNFKFFKKFWDLIKVDLINALKWFWAKGEISKGCNASFITLVPKKSDPIGLSDFRPISLIGCYYKILAKILSIRLRKVVPYIVGDEQSAFLKGRFILDGALIINETVDFLSKHRKKSAIFKVDFEKAFVSLDWDFLMVIMEKMGFGEKWRGWILACLKSASILVLVNGSPTNEFTLERGVRQGDPLSPFLFIIAAEGLNILTKNAVEKGLFKGVKVGADKVMVSHLQYADDTIFIGEWSRLNICNLMKLLECFEKVLGLKVNYHKSSISGMGVIKEEVERMAKRVNCKIGELPFNYLGIPIGCNMNRVESWKPVVDRFNSKLSK
ncbi:uncharacterized protein [Rutidosis leptorrhynchoides]|uniref:uncharacterized protein n=1 Tax=Rutidosis leptorrhynchoides TaxID=125765 RepID=UPI003A999D39